MDSFLKKPGSFELQPIKELGDLISNYKKGKIALPDFQRKWIWTAPMVHNLIDSLVRGYPIGSIITIKTDEEMRKDFGCEPFEVEMPRPDFEKNQEVELVLDGQQRLTSLLQIFTSDGIKLKKKARGSEKVWYYVDLKQLLKSGENEIILDFYEVSKRGRIVHDPNKHDDSPRDEKIEIPIPNNSLKEFEELIIPIKTVLYQTAKDEWKQAYLDYKNRNLTQDVIEVHNLIDILHNRLMRYQIPRVILDSETKFDQVCGIFENMNTNMIILSVFDLLTARYAKDKYKLHKEWKSIVKANRIGSSKSDEEDEDSQEEENDEADTQLDRMVSNFYKPHNKQEEKIDFARMTTLCYKEDKNEKPLKKDKEMLKLPSADFDIWKGKIQLGIRRAYQFLLEEKIPGTTTKRTQFMVLSAIFSYLIENEKENDEESEERIRKWFWRAALYSRYGDRALGHAGEDFRQVCDWILKGEGNPLGDWISDKGGLENIRPMKEILSLLPKNGGGMESYGKAFSQTKKARHHIFPQKWCDTKGLPKEDWNSVVNLMEMPSKINSQDVKDKEPKYLALILEREIGPEKAKEVFEKNEINPDYLANNDFYGFFEDRKERLTKLVEQATGIKRPSRDSDTKAD